MQCFGRSLLSLAAMGLAISAGSECLARTLFPTPLTLLARSPMAMAIADMDADGVPDLVVGDSREAVLLRGAGDGPFLPWTRVAFDAAVSALAAADLDGDGDVDLAAVLDPSGGIGSVVVLWGDGQGSLERGPSFSLGVHAASVAAVDLQADGIIDLATQDGSGVSVFLGQGGGSFADPLTLPAYSLGAGFAIADFTQDGRLDILVAQSSPGVSRVFAGSAAGGFLDPVTSSILHLSDGFVTGDFTGDGILDLVAARDGTYKRVPSGLALHRGRGDGTFDSPRFTTFEGVPRRIVSADFNGDGRSDVAGEFIPAGQFHSEVFVVLGRRDGSFSPVRRVVSFYALLTLAVGDFDGDASIDLAIGGNDSLTGILDVPIQAPFVGVLAGRGNGTFGPQVRFSNGEYSGRVIGGDFNGDGILDAAVARPYSLSISLGIGHGLFGTPLTVQGAPGARALGRGDFDGDGDSDLAEIDDNGELWTFLSGSDGVPGAPVRTMVGAGPRSLDVHDDDGDGRDDLLIANLGRQVCLTGSIPAACVWAEGDVRVLHSMGDGRFAAGVIMPEYQPEDAVWCDFDRDGVKDVAYLHFDGTRTVTRTFLRDAVGGFQPATAFHGPTDSLGCADVNEDGIPDLLSLEPRALAVWPGAGDGTFGARVDTPLEAVGQSVEAAASAAGSPEEAAGQVAGPQSERLYPFDADGDDHLDLAIGTLFLAGRGDGTFARLGYFLAAGSPVVPGDFNMDGWIDLASRSGLVMFNQNGVLDLDGDSVPDETDTCPTIANPDQDPEVCLQTVVDVALSFGESLRRDAGSVIWRTTHEVDVLGFNVVFIDKAGRRSQLNGALIPCKACESGQGAEYSHPLLRHRTGRGLYVELVSYADSELFAAALQRTWRAGAGSKPGSSP